MTFCMHKKSIYHDEYYGLMMEWIFMGFFKNLQILWKFLLKHLIRREDSKQEQKEAAT